VEGREFTVLVVGNGTTYPPAERVFPDGLPPRERLLSYERYWEDYNEETPLPPGVPLYRYASVESPLRARLEELATRAYRALEGCGYARVDMRMDSAGEIYVLEVNSNCGLSSDGQTSVSWILNLSGRPIQRLIAEIIHDAWDRAQSPAARTASTA
jgi:D-alanine-D-alanine ligase-like ATP-grasp enzyme